jgi:hypothetical protein
MSTRIIDDIRAVKIPQYLHGISYEQDIHILCELGGDNNVIDTATNRRARHWSAVAIGDTSDVIGKICAFAGSFEGGMRRFVRGKGTPEIYIKRCRQALANASLIGQSDLHISLRIRFNEEEKEQDKYYYTALLEAGVRPKQEMFYGRPEQVFDFRLEQIPVWLKGVRGPAWRNAHVSGPGEV